MRIRYSVLIFSITLFFTACGKKLLPTASYDEAYALENFDFEYLQTKSKINFSSTDRNLGSSATIRMKKDSIIWISVSPIFGIEAARGYINQDTIVFIDRVNKEAHRYNYKSLSNMLNFEINFQMLQAILLGNQVFEFDREDKFSKKLGELRIDQERGRFQLQTAADQENRKISKIRVNEIPDGSQMEIIFAAFNAVANQIFPYEAKVTIESEGTNGKEITTVEINHSKVDAGNTPLSFPFSIPGSYEN